ncbi:PKD domain-containing protein [Serinicoccus marinus]|uniref:PKD domain-containing protein n=1 Tax=Serinicoccus marinus TaxID=247333 RepID=UPI00122E9417|nr:PKD domain-containing protein [Serinicoccus marinus]
MINGEVYSAWSDGSFTRQTFDGSQFGTPDPVDTADELVVLRDWRNDISRATGMFFDNGRVYFTLSGSNQLFYRYLTTESGIVGAKRFVASNSVAGINFDDVRGMFATSDDLYWATSNGALHRIDLATGAQASNPVPGTAETVSGPNLDGKNWAGRDMFLFQDADGNAAPQPPVASFTNDCASLTCNFDASASVAEGSTITAYEWDFGDGATGAGEAPTHEYAADDTYSVTLTITTDAGDQDTATGQVEVERVNEVPVAAFASVCDELVCSFDASGSTDDGEIVSYAWDFGDGGVDAGETVTHTYSEAGEFTVELTVTDAEGETGSATQAAYAVTSGVDFVAGGSTNGNRVQHTVQVPGEVEAGDLLLLFFTANTDSVTVAGPSGWTEEESRASGNMSAQLWSRPATAGDAGSTVVVNTSGWAKSDLSIVAYRGQGGQAQVTSTVSEISNVSNSHATPDVDALQGGSWLVSYWGGKSGSLTEWALPAGQVERTGSVGTGGGHVTAALADSGGAIAVGATGGVVAEADANARAALFSILVTTQAAAPPQNEVPVAAFASVCDELVCSFDASGSTDDGEIVSYAWDFGDGGVDAGETVTHTYSEAGEFTVELTVTDAEGETGSATQAAYAVTSGVDFVAGGSTNGNRVQHTVQVPGEVEAGDLLLLFFTANTDSVTVAGPSGWTEEESRASGNMSAQLWSRPATAGDAGSTVVVNTSGWAKSDLSIVAYRGQGGQAQVTSTVSEISNVSNSHATPDVDALQGGSWLVSYWGGKSGSLTEWALPAGQVERTGSVGTGGGHVTAALADSGGAIAVGATGGVVAEADANARAALFSILVTTQAE